ncbi:unnamed protein product [Notodromas monacha]|uniref:HMG box domain-containing protein n=1 Tax=Notodromas monacha TaxID=399045 RepID=A0A7R9BJP9_9CRUS|nr:unnamed protein product [Notodromas monacha]CAG0915366.1 unnamed protein product [Notodromas monacha]
MEDDCGTTDRAEQWPPASLSQSMLGDAQRIFESYAQSYQRHHWKTGLAFFSSCIHDSLERSFNSIAQFTMPRPSKDESKPKGRMSAYAYFLQSSREEQKKANPDETLSFTEFTKKCSEKWKKISDKEKTKYHKMAEKDKARYDDEMKDYIPPAGGKVRGKRSKKDPAAPKRALSAFFWFCDGERAKIRKENPGSTVGDVAKELGRRWALLNDSDKVPFQKMAEKDKVRYEKEMAEFKNGAAKSSRAPKPKGRNEPVDDDDEEEEEEDEEEDEDEDDE